MYYGNPKTGREADTEFKNAVDKYSAVEVEKGSGKTISLLEVMLAVEGLKSGCSSHASGIIILNEPLENKCAYMRTPSGELITCWDLHECEQTGLK